MNKIETKVWPVAEKAALKNGFWLYDLEYLKEGASKVLRIYVDKDGGVTMNDCEAFSREMDALLDEGDVLNENYMLEVSSPGVLRRLRLPQHFEKYLGSEVCVKLFKELMGSKTHIGVLKGYNNTIEIDAGGEILNFETKDIASVNLHYNF